MLENDAAKKTTKNLSPKCRQQDQNGVKTGWGGPFDAGDVPKITKIHKFAKMDPRGVPGSKRHPKGNQKASKRHPKGVQKPSKRCPN